MHLIESTAYFEKNNDGTEFRYYLKRVWDKTLPIVAFVLFNPSESTELLTDPTVNNCISLALRWHCGGIIIVNLYAKISSISEKLKSKYAASIGVRNDEFIEIAALESNCIVAAWGQFDGVKARAKAVMKLLEKYEVYRIGNYVGEKREPYHPRRPGISISDDLVLHKAKNSITPILP
jgi:hypothetical protein